MFWLASSVKNWLKPNRLGSKIGLLWLFCILIIKAPFHDPQPLSLIPDISQKIEISYQLKPLGTVIMFVWKIFLADSFVWQNNYLICMTVLDVNVRNYNKVVYVTGLYSKSYITHKHKIKLNCKLGIMLIDFLKTSNELTKKKKTTEKQTKAILIGRIMKWR